MTKRLPATPAPGPLEDYAVRFDDLFGTLAQRQAFRRYLEGLLLPTERNKTLTTLANTEPVVGAQRKEAQGLQWFLSESSWDPERINRRRVELMLEETKTAPSRSGALVIDETGDRKGGKKTAHVGKQYLGSIGKIDNGVVSVSSLWADERFYYPLEVEPYTPAHHFEEGKADPEFRSKPKIALELVERAVEMELPFRAVVADILYGEHRKFKEGLESRQIPYVLAIKPSYAWYCPIGEPGSVEEIAWIAPWKGDDDPGQWVKLERTFRDGHTEQWWALEAECRPFGVEKQRRLVVATTDPTELPDHTTWYLVSNLPAPGTKRAKEESKISTADIAEVVRLYFLRSWIEQSYKQVKNSLGWSQYQVRKDLAIRRHWQLVCCAFAFCWWANASFLEGEAPPGVILNREETARTSTPPMVERGKKEDQEEPTSLVLAGGVEKGKEVAGAIPNAMALLEGILREAPAQGVKRVA
jgi:DDE superfamily endonuclease